MKKIKLMQFDKTKNLKKIISLKKCIAVRDETMAKIKEQLIEMTRQENYSNISHILNMLRGKNDEE